MPYSHIHVLKIESSESMASDVKTLNQSPFKPKSKFFINADKDDKSMEEAESQYS